MLNYNFISCLAILVWCFSLLLKSHSFSTHTNETDRLALLAIKSKLHDPFGVTSSWNNSIELCQWTGVTCGHRHQRVTELDLGNKSIGGFLSPCVGNLSFLRYINIADNGFYGEIPHEIGRLCRLETLALSNNSFSGKIPTNMSCCTNLISFTAYRNNLVGEIPADIGYNLLKLERLSMAANNLTGKLPASIGNLSELQQINVAGNSLGGRIPNTLGHLRNLVYINLGGNNKFSGTVSSSIYNTSSLELIFLYQNTFVGTLPLDLGATLPNLRRFVVYENNLTGSLPDSLSNASNLEELDISKNLFSGKVSLSFSSLKNLVWLNLGKNNLGIGTAIDLDFVTSLTNCSRLDLLALYNNHFGGVLPHSIANLSTTITAIEIRINQISGTIPPGMKNLVNLNTITMEFNQLSGTIPPGIGELKDLQALYLDANLLQGTIPSSLGNLTLLTELVLDLNNLIGNIPSSLGNCQNLRMLSLSQNKLNGTLPKQVLGILTLSIILDLSSNNLSGSLPSEVGTLKNLVQLDISNNQFSGEIPATLSACSSLEYLNLHGNSFRGSIPSSLNLLRSITVLDLSSNIFSGPIPKFLEDLSFLKNLNLSYNHFEGEVPTQGVFTNKSGISIFGNGKLCGGVEELHLPSCHSKAKGSLKIVIPVIVSSFIFFVCFTVVYIRRRKPNHNLSDTLHVEQPFPMVSFAELSKATNEFSSSNMIGQGSFGFVYKGILGENGTVVAVKVINLLQKGASSSFAAECEALRNTRHRNLVKIITICSSIDFKGGDFKALVYEYMQNGCLEQWLHQGNDLLEECNLNLIRMLNIAIDVASAIEYLHHHCQPPIIHGDLKPSNVLLDQDMVAHVGDFGLARFLFDRPHSTAHQTQSSSIGIKGTVGYVAPEYGMGSKVSMPGDVYSYGILLLEMFTRRRPTDSMFNDGLTLHEFVKMVLPEKVMEIVETTLLLELEVMTSNSKIPRNGMAKMEDCLVSVLRTGVLCSMESPAERMEMTKVVSKLCHARDNFLAT